MLHSLHFVALLLFLPGSMGSNSSRIFGYHACYLLGFVALTRLFGQQDLLSKLDWVSEAAIAAQKNDELKEHVPGILKPLIATLQLKMASAKQPDEANKCRMVLHIVNGTLHHFS